MDTGRVDTKDRKVNIIRRIWNRLFPKLSIKEYNEKLRTLNKSELIKEIICLAQKINKNDMGVESKFKKQLRSVSKRKLIKTLIVLQLENNKQVKKLRKKYAKTKRRGIPTGVREPMRAHSNG